MGDAKAPGAARRHHGSRCECFSYFLGLTIKVQCTLTSLSTRYALCLLLLTWEVARMNARRRVVIHPVPQYETISQAKASSAIIWAK